ncbi:hypothetical protein PHYBOEH_006104 [Phytophthora boehmeriae]|uniref:DUSP domain-containing protein n=1 Tax=Phytophthora boehmeriae TaxID=109152 RepID=A0A8T1X2M5_9STRA|nr:hypothetical protein PHYBOEH_006104 [Phytophthora boehmeriae]
METQASARWLMGTSSWEFVEVEAPPGALGVVLDGDDLDRPVLTGFAAVSGGARGAVELSGRVPVGSLLVGLNEYNFRHNDMIFEDVAQLIRDTSHLQRFLRFQVPQITATEGVSSVPLSQQFAPRRGPPPREEDEEQSEEEEEEESEEEKQVFYAAPVAVTTEESDLPLSQQFAPRRGPPPREEESEEEETDEDYEEEEKNVDGVPDSPVPQLPDEEKEEEEEFRPENVVAVASGSGSSAGDSFQEIHMAEVAAEAALVVDVADEQVSSEASWTFTGSKSPLTSSASSSSPEKVQQFPLDETRSNQEQTKRALPGELALPAALPADLSFGTMAKAQARHFDSDDSSDDDDDEEDDDYEEIPVSNSSSWVVTKSASSISPEDPQDLLPEKRSPKKRSPVPLSQASNVSSGTIAASLMAQANQFDRDETSEDDNDAEYVTAVAPPGPLGLNLDGGVLDCAVVMGFAKMRDGSKGPLERHGDIVPGSILVRINGEDFSHASLSEVRVRLSELSMKPRTLVFRLPPRNQREERNSLLQTTAMQRTPTLPRFQEDLDKRRKMELALVMHYDKTALARRECWFCVDADWMARWVAFAARGGPEPGPISNENLLQTNWRDMLAHDAPGRADIARDGLVLMKDYRVVAPMVWCLFAELHGLGEAPLLARYPMDIHAEPLSEGEVANILKVPRPKATALANNLRDKCLVRPSRAR